MEGKASTEETSDSDPKEFIPEYGQVKRVVCPNFRHPALTSSFTK